MSFLANKLCYDPRMKILALDTSSHICSVALLNDEKVTSQNTAITLKQAQIILSQIDELLRSENTTLNQLDAIAFGCGPGSFTGVRIAASVTQGLAYSLKLPVIPISSMEALAYGTYLDLKWDNLLVGIDARMHEIYWSAYTIDSRGLPLLLGEEILCKPEEVSIPAKSSWTGVGNAWEVYQDRIPFKPSHLDPTRYPTADAIARLASTQFHHQNWVEAHKAIPVYLRNNVAKKQA